MEHIEREVQLPNPPVEVWEAVIDPARLGEWLGGELDVSLRPGGRGSFRSPDGGGPTAHRAPRRRRPRAVVLVVAGDRCRRGEHGHDHGRRATTPVDRPCASTRRARHAGHARDGDGRRHERQQRRSHRRGVLRAVRRDAALGARSGLPRRVGHRDRARGDAAGEPPGGGEAPPGAGRAGLVTSARDGREVRYSFAAAPLADAAEWIAEEGANWDDRLDRLRRSFA